VKIIKAKGREQVGIVQKETNCYVWIKMDGPPITRGFRPLKQKHKTSIVVLDMPDMSATSPVLSEDSDNWEDNRVARCPVCSTRGPAFMECRKCGEDSGSRYIPGG
jgi:hypothetical protein